MHEGNEISSYHRFGRLVKIRNLVCPGYPRCFGIGDQTTIDAFVYVEEDVYIGNNVRIRFTFIPTGLNISENVFPI